MSTLHVAYIALFVAFAYDVIKGLITAVRYRTRRLP